MRRAIAKVFQQEDINFLVTNRIPRQALTRFMGWFSRIEHPWVRDLSLAVWRVFSDLDLSEARKTSFRSLHDCFTRELKEGARPVDPDPAVVTSPCDAIVGACGSIEGDTLIQAKGLPYTLRELLGDPDLERIHRGGTFVTLRLTSTMYHRFHAPHDCRVRHVTYVSGDTWNVNPIALKRVEKLFCRNERAIIRAELCSGGHALTLVPVAAVLVASMRLRFADVLLHLRYRGPNEISCDASLAKGQEMGWFEHGSTIIVLAPPGFSLCGDVRTGEVIRMGRPLLRLP
ncbi:MAG: archaetidylserine decarboxylase [Betaproteobacteria bacterium]|jgi:phosphatidylserine decarboxylase